MMRALSLHVGLITALLAGCDAEPAKSADAKPADAKPADIRPATAAPDPTRPADGGMDVPPAGIYEITVNVVSDDCTPKYTPPAPGRRVAVSAKARPGDARLNVPFIGLPPDGSNTYSARNDLMVLPPREVSHTSATQCGPFELTTSLTNATREGFSLNFTTKYGPSRPDCATPMPSACTTTIEQIFKLVEFQCAAECSRSTRSVPGEPLKQEIDCRCP